MSEDDWIGQERRAPEGVIIAVMNHTKEVIREEMQAARNDINERFNHLESLIRSAFPDGDPEGHRRAHEAQIQSAKDWSEIWLEIKKKIVSGVAYAAVIAIGYALLDWVRGHLK